MPKKSPLISNGDEEKKGKKSGLRGLFVKISYFYNNLMHVLCLIW